ncbi:thiamine-monophosphate kinase [Paenibacillus rhizovicinus]|uniref:Thiamine-monophosphate kinase n=1 Tax=Paenibacillus rhizovicinus TaxID=2704463 RepID=A0A6C0P366_9BACL|nr:AIR synthase related protein [Paenibacillus rhizovicinus]QHW33010.1 thiamine-monophosphate kinase [Paenibacillus rhizovicinus]
MEGVSLDEFARIRHWTERRQSKALLASQGVVLGIGDDAAVVGTPPGESGALEWLLAVDTMVETVHFNDATMAEADVGWKALAANVSDIAAMGGTPRHALVSVSVPKTWEPERVRRLYDGLYACAEHYGVAVVGGDTTSSPLHLVVAVTVTGTVAAGRAVSRAGARPGDAVFVTGAAGMSAAGLHFLLAAAAAGEAAPAVAAQPGGGAASGSPLVAAAAAASAPRPQPVPPAAAEAAGTAALVQAHRRPAPSVRAAALLAARGTVTSLNDVSDGLASEAWEIAEASGVKLALRESRLPKSGSLTAYANRCGVDPLEWILYGGEDYVLLGTIAAGDADAAKAELEAAGLPMYLIGVAEAGPAAVALVRDYNERGQAKQEPLAKRGYNHFGG